MNDEPLLKIEKKHFPWKMAMQFGFGILHLSPTQFWSMTLVEFNNALQVYFGNITLPLRRDNLDSLMQKYPDK